MDVVSTEVGVATQLGWLGVPAGLEATRGLNNTPEDGKDVDDMADDDCAAGDKMPLVLLVEPMGKLS